MTDPTTSQGDVEAGSAVHRDADFYLYEVALTWLADHDDPWWTSPTAPPSRAAALVVFLFDVSEAELADDVAATAATKNSPPPRLPATNAGVAPPAGTDTLMALTVSPTGRRHWRLIDRETDGMHGKPWPPPHRGALAGTYDRVLVTVGPVPPEIAALDCDGRAAWAAEQLAAADEAAGGRRREAPAS